MLTPLPQSPSPILNYQSLIPNTQLNPHFSIPNQIPFIQSPINSLISNPCPALWNQARDEGGQVALPQTGVPRS